MSVLLIAVPATLATVVVMGIGWRRWMKHRKEEEARRKREAALAAVKLPEDGVFIANRATRRQLRRALKGTYLIAGVGTYGMEAVLKLLLVLWQTGLEGIVGSVLIVENAETLRELFALKVPEVFADRIVYGFSKDYTEAFENRPVEESLECVDFWGVPIRRATEKAIDQHLRRNASGTPEIWLFVSEGGQVVLSVPVTETLNAKWPEARIVGFTALPVDTALRKNFEWVKPQLEARGLYGWVGLDNLSANPSTLDWALVALLVVLAQGGLYEGQSLRAGNGFTLVFGDKPGAIAIYQVVADAVVGYPLAPDGSDALGFYVFKGVLVSSIRRALRRIARNQGLWSIDLPVGDRSVTTVDAVITSVVPDELREIQETVNEGRELRKQTLAVSRNGSGSKEDYYGEENYHTVFGAVGIAIDTPQPVCPVVVVRLTRVLGGGRHLVKEIIKPPKQRQLRRAGSRLALPVRKDERERLV